MDIVKQQIRIRELTEKPRPTALASRNNDCNSECIKECLTANPDSTATSIFYDCIAPLCSCKSLSVVKGTSLIEIPLIVDSDLKAKIYTDMVNEDFAEAMPETEEFIKCQMDCLMNSAAETKVIK